jgi:murein L,D-transpeptidase YcbB/YkuD
MGSTRREHRLRLMGPIVAAALLAPLPQIALTGPAQAQARGQGVARQAPLQREIADRAGKELRAFYAARGNQPLWLNEFGRPSGAASMLMHHLRTAQFDGVDAKKLRFERLARQVDDARRGDADDVAKAEVALSTAFAAYVRAMRAAGREEMIYESAALAPVVPTPRESPPSAA